MSTASLTIYTDGGARGNPGPAGAGAVLLNNEEVVAEVSEYLGETTNNVAEYTALIHALETALTYYGAQLQTMSVEVRMDSELIVKQMQGAYRVKDAKLKLLFARVQELRASIPFLTFTHVRRAYNAHADRLVNSAIDRALGLR